MYVEKTDKGYNLMCMPAAIFRAVLKSVKIAAQHDKQINQLSKLMEREQNEIHRPGRNLPANEQGA